LRTPAADFLHLRGTPQDRNLVVPDAQGLDPWLSCISGEDARGEDGQVHVPFLPATFYPQISQITQISQKSFTPKPFVDYPANWDSAFGHFRHFEF
jgi:hypothetical protein